MTTAITATSPIIEFVTFYSGGQCFSIEISQVREIRRWGPFTSVPHSPTGVLGVMNLRGSVIPIYDLAARLGLAETPENPRNVIVVVMFGEQILGLLVESVSEIMSVARDKIQITPEMRAESGQTPIAGLINTETGMTQIVDLASIIRTKGLAAA
jgi:purine-binding chemotaxis protein CheW